MGVFSFLFVTLLFTVTLSLKPCPQGQFNSSGTCIPCPKGTWRADRTDPNCRPCAPGTAGVQVGGVYPYFACRECRPGFFSKEPASTKCTRCPRGTRSGYAYSKCVSCAKGSALDPRRGADSCLKCPRGTFHDGGPELLCKPCAPGTVAVQGGAKQCRKCPPGTFEETEKDGYDGNGHGTGLLEVDRTGCIKCAAGTFAEVAGLSSCKICRPGTFSPRGATSCTPCPAGKFAPGIAGRKCQDCPAGTTSLGLRPAACKHPVRGCTFDSFENDDGECEKCVPGEKYNPRTNKCEPCRSNQVSTGGVTTECRSCPNGEVPARGFSLRDGVTCVCELGTERTWSGCVPCKEGFFGTFQDSEEDDKNGKRTLANAKTFAEEPCCLRCPRGTSSKAGSTKCERCDAGFHIVDGECLPCPNGFESRITSLVQNESPHCISKSTACRFEYVRRGRSCSFESCRPNERMYLGDCLSCQPGDYMTLINARCFRCPPKQTSPGGIVTSCSPCRMGKIGLAGQCYCPTNHEERNGKCVKCQLGSYADIHTGCIECGAGTFGSVRLRCEPCPRNKVTTVKGGATECVACPKGSREGRDLFGYENNKCVPVDPYNKNPSFLASLPGFEAEE